MLGDRVAAEDAAEGLHRYGLVHRPADGYVVAARLAHYLARLPDGPARAALETLLDEYPAQLAHGEMLADAGRPHTRDLLDGLDELERHSAIHCAEGDYYWPTRACQRFEQLASIGCAADDDDDDER